MQVWAGSRNVTKAKTFDELRLQSFMKAKGRIDVLPPTSCVFKKHIERAAFPILKAWNLLKSIGHNEKKNHEVTDYGLEKYFRTLLPSNSTNSLPQHILTVCKCAGKFDIRRCGCNLADVKCVTFCHENKDKTQCLNQ